MLEAVCSFLSISYHFFHLFVFNLSESDSFGPNGSRNSSYRPSCSVLWLMPPSLPELKVTGAGLCMVSVIEKPWQRCPGENGMPKVRQVLHNSFDHAAIAGTFAAEVHHCRHQTHQTAWHASDSLNALTCFDFLANTIQISSNMNTHTTRCKIFNGWTSSLLCQFCHTLPTYPEMETL